MKTKTILLALLVCLSSIETGAKVIVAYVTSWSEIMPDPAYVTHINYAFGHVSESFDGVKINNENRLKRIVELKQKAPSLKIMLSIGGWGSGRFSEMAADDALRKKFAADCQRVVSEFNLDGIDIDWEYPTSSAAKISSSPGDTKNFTLLMRDIREAIGNGHLLTLATVAHAKYIDFRAIDPYVDFVNIMAYDMAYPPHHHSALYRSKNAGDITSDEAVKAHLAAGVPAGKLVLGMPFYGRGAKPLSGFLDYKNIEKLEGYSRQWDETAQVPYLTDAESVFVCGYEDPHSLAIKCQYILDHGLLGGMYWDYAGDNEAGDLRKTVYKTLFMPTSSVQLCLTSDAVLEKAIIQSGVIHSPLSLDVSRSYEANGLKKKVLSRKTVPIHSGWTHSGLGELTYSTKKNISGTGSLKMNFPTFTGKRAAGSPSDKDYATYGNCRIQRNMNGENWEKFNRIEFSIYPDCEGARVVNLDFSFENADIPKKTGTNRRSASHLINLKNREWNRCFLDLDEFQRDKVLRIGFSCSIKGKDRTTGDESVFYINGLELQQVENPEIVSGWMPGQHKISYSTSGYELNHPKTAIVNLDKNKSFQLLDAITGRMVFESTVQPAETTLGTFGILDFTTFNQAGDYRLQWGETATPPFRIGNRIWENSLWRVLNYVFCQRCGYPVPGIHSTCHTDLCSEHNGQKISYAGGWHDAGDLSQQTLQTGDVTYSLLELYKNQKGKNDLLAGRLLEEAEWGLEFILKNRYGDGYRASSMGLLIWQDGVFGTLDDITSVRVQNLAFDNFLYAAYEAYAAMTIDHDPALQEYLEKTAKADFEFALQKYKKDGFDKFLQMYEHSYNTSESQYMATVSWAASMLYKLTKNPYYAGLATEYISYTLDCQRKEPLNDKAGTRGFFYRDRSRKSIVHYIHQSREQVYMQALTLLCETQPQHPDHRQWTEAIRLYGDYLKSLMPYTAPYGMLPSGVYHIDEYRDTENFNHLHLFPPENAAELYVEQVKKGIPLDREHYIKRFPVWFGIFNGNTAVHLSMGKAAAICGHFLHDEELLHIGREQMEWTVGKNPFGQSLIYGEGANYPQMDSFSSGEITGEMPVGIRSLDNEDIPYWPQVNNACYKEVWVTSAGKWLSLQSEY